MENATHFIVFDIERNFRPYKSEDPSEIVDIGAVKNRSKYNEGNWRIFGVSKTGGTTYSSYDKINGNYKERFNWCWEIPANYRKILFGLSEKILYLLHGEKKIIDFYLMIVRYIV